MRSARSAVVIAASLCVSVLASTEATAQKPPEVGKADALFNAARSLLEAGEYADACPKFAESQKLAPGLGVTLYLADCYERLGRTASALTEFRRAVQIASTRGDKRGAIAADRAAALQNHVPQLVIVVTPAARAQGVTVTRDGEVVPDTQWDTPTQMDPGEHDIAVSAPSKTTRHQTAKLVADKTPVTTVVDALEDPPAPLPPSSLPATDMTATTAPSKTQKWIGLTTGAAGVVGIGVGAVLGILTISKLHESNAGPCNATDHCSIAGQGLRADAEHLGNASTIAFSVGGAALAGGALLYFTAPKAQRHVMGIEIEPLFSPSAMGVGARGSF